MKKYLYWLNINREIRHLLKNWLTEINTEYWKLSSSYWQYLTTNSKNFNKTIISFMKSIKSKFENHLTSDLSIAVSAKRRILITINFQLKTWFAIISFSLVYIQNINWWPIVLVASYKTINILFFLGLEIYNIWLMTWLVFKPFFLCEFLCSHWNHN